MSKNSGNSEPLQKTEASSKSKSSSDQNVLVMGALLVLIGFACLYYALDFYGSSKTAPPQLIAPEERALSMSLDSLDASTLPELAVTFEKLNELGQGAFDFSMNAGVAKKDAEPVNDDTKGASVVKPAAKPKDKPTGKTIGDYKVYADRIGEYVDVDIIFNGELWDQLLFLETFYEELGDSVAVKAAAGTMTNLKIEARIYGRQQK